YFTAAGVIVYVVALLVRFKHSRQNPSTLAEVASVAAMLTLMPPLLGFAIYFAFWHSLRHLLSDLIDAPSAAGDQERPLAPVVTATVLPLVVAAGAWLAIVFFGEQARSATSAITSASAASTSVQVVFVTLGCLTVPHMVLVAWSAGRGGHGQQRENKPATPAVVTNASRSSFLSHLPFVLRSHLPW
ncbi:MAG: Brp/Blh family beta-carotene 15,15'-dioxygenase, partial [Planctomycetota bacterium]